MLSPYRVLDCTDEKGHLAGMILEDLLGYDAERITELVVAGALG